MADKQQPPQLFMSGRNEIVGEGNVDLRRYIYIISKYKWMILSFTIFAGLFTTVLAYSIQPIYRSTATLLIGDDEPVMGSEKDIYASQLAKDQFYNTQFELLKSREVLSTALAKMKGDKNTWNEVNNEINRYEVGWRTWLPASWRKEKNKEAIPHQESDPGNRKLRWLMNNLEMMSVRNTSIAKVSFEASDPKLTALVANAVAAAYIDTNLEHRIQSTKVASEWLKQQIERSKRAFDKAIDDLQRYRESVGMISVGGTQSLHDEQLKTVVDQLGEAEKARAEAENLYHRAERLKESGQLDALPIVFNSLWIQQLKRDKQGLERKINLDNDRYQGAYPGREEAERKLETLNSQIESALKQIVEGLKSDYLTALETERRLQAKQSDLKKKVQALNRQKLKADELEQIVASNRQSYDAYMSQLMKTKTKHSDNITLIARLVDPAVPELIPVRPKKTLMIATAVMLAGFVGIGFAFIREGSIFHNKLKTREDVENKIGLPLLGELTILPKKRENGSSVAPATEFLHQPKSVFAESIRTIRAGIFLSRHTQSTPAILVTSTVSGEGKSMVALNLALAMSRLGNVLLIDADLRRPSLASLCDLDPKSAGLVDLVEGSRKAAECIAQIAGDIHLLPAGSALPLDTMKIFASTRFASLLTVFSQVYDCIVIDSSPVDIVSDVNMLAGQVSGIVYVIEADSTPYQAVKQGVNSLSKAGATLIGAVLNQVNPRKVSAYGKFKYGYYRSFDHYGQPIQEG